MNMKSLFRMTLIALVVFCCFFESAANGSLSLIRPSRDGTHFVRADSNSRFTIWGFNYEHDNDGLISGSDWKKHWPAVVEDFKIMKSLGANTIRIHLQTFKYMPTPAEPNQAALDELTDMLKLAEKMGIYLDITGLACYRKDKVARWYKDANEPLRWAVQARFWQAVAQTCKDSPAVIFYDLMNEPVVPSGKPTTDMLAGDAFGGKFYVQNITLDPAGRAPPEIAKAWVEKLTAAIKKYDKNRMITIGEIPWSQTWPGWKPLFHSREIGRYLDFVSVHMYPKTNEIPKALDVLNAYKVGKPILVEEMFPLSCTAEEMESYMAQTKNIVAGWITFFWRDRDALSNAVVLEWAKRFQKMQPEMADPNTL